MLYDTRWSNPKPWTLEHLIQWLGTKQGEYVYSDSTNCMLAQYTKEMGYGGVKVTCSRVSYRFISWLALPFWMSKELPEHFNEIAYHGNYTFEAALKRAIAVRTNAELARLPQDRPAAASAPLERTA